MNLTAGSASAPPLLSVHGLRKGFGSRPLLAIEQLAILPGEALLLIGPNGAGKSTLLRILAGLERADGGRFYLNGRRLRGSWQNQLRGRVIYLHQHPYLFDSSVRANVGYGLRQLDIPPPEREQRIDQALEWSGLPHLQARHAKTLSGGEQQRIALARAWVLRPELLLLDEPTANMDHEAREQTYFLIRRLVSEGTSVVLTGHGIKSDHPMLNRTLELSRGELIPLTEALPDERPPQSGKAATAQQRRLS